MCKERCQPPCNYWEYSGSLSYANFPSPLARELVEDEREWRQLQNTIVIEMFFEHLEYTLIKHENSQTPNSFIAQIGGQVKHLV